MNEGKTPIGLRRDFGALIMLIRNLVEKTLV